MGRRWKKGRFGHEDIVALAEGTASLGQSGDGEWIRSDRTQQDAMWISIPPQTEHNHVPRPLLFGTGSGDEGRRQFDARSDQKRLGDRLELRTVVQRYKTAGVAPVRPERRGSTP